MRTFSRYSSMGTRIGTPARVAVALLVSTAPSAASAQERLEVVTTLPTYAAITREITGDLANVTAIARGDEDAHFVSARPSFARLLQTADMFVSTGLDLELWVPSLLQRANNSKILEGTPGNIVAFSGIELLDVPANVSRSGGDVHLYGNPHIFTSPLNVKRVAENIARALEAADPDGAQGYRARLGSFVDRMNASLYGAELVEMLGAETLDSLARSGRLVSFLEGQEFEGRPLIERLGGWLGRGLAFRDHKIVAYHKNWIYFTDLFGLDVIDYVEPKPGIPPSARHVHKLIGRIADNEVKVILAANYFSARQIQSISDRTGCAAVIVPLGPGGDGPADYFSLVDLWVDGLAEAFSE